MTAAAPCIAPRIARPLASRIADVRPATPAELCVEYTAQALWHAIGAAADPQAEFTALARAAREMHYLYRQYRAIPDPTAAQRDAAQAAETLYWLAAYRLDTHITGATPDADTLPF